ncbi:MAG TPA: hypothetical protein VGA77_05455 [Propylenella sp.]
MAGPQTGSAACAAGAVMVSAFCTGSWETYPLQTSGSEASCGDAQVTVVCMAQ